MKLWRRFRHFLHRRQFDADLAEEIQIHREMADPRDFGNATLALESSRAVWRYAWLESLSQDIRYAMRGFAQRPAFALTVVGTIGLALGLNTALFTIANAYVFRPFAVHDPYNLYLFGWHTRDGNRYRFSWRDFDELRKQDMLTEVTAAEAIVVRFSGMSAIGQAVTGNFFNSLGVQAALGRTILPDDDAVAGGGAVIALSYSAWKNRYASDPGILGRKIYIHGQPLEVVGVIRPEFAGLSSAPYDFWVPLSMSPLLDAGPSLYTSDRVSRLELIGRLKPGIGPDQAKAALSAWARRITANRAEGERATGALLESRATSIFITPEVIAVFSPVVAAFALVLLIACANVANMMLARGLARQREIGIRLSLGAARSRLVRQLLTESLMLAIPAAGVGFLISLAATGGAQRLLYATLPPEVARLVHVFDLAPDYRVFAFLLVTAVLCTLIFGLTPALQATRSALVQANRGDFSNELRPARLRNALVISQVMVCSLLLICAAVVLRNGSSQSKRDVRLDPHGVVDINMQERFQVRATERLRAERWVEAVGTAWRAPLFGPLPTLPVSVTGANARVWAGYNFVSPEYFTVFRVPVLRGRSFTAEEAAAEAPLAIVSEATAAKLWPHEDALGQTIGIVTVQRSREFRSPHFTAAHVIGIARDVVSGWVGDGLDATCIYFPTAPGRAGNPSLLVRVRGEAEVLRTSIDTTLAASLPGAADQINPMDQVLAIQIYPFRAVFWIASTLGGLALVLTVSGIYGVLSYLVGQRTREIGIRMALGASTAGVVRFVLSQSIRLALIGIVLGVLIAFGLAWLIATRLEMLKVFDVAAFGSVALLVAVAALAASYFPSRRAVQVDPATTLRCE